MDSNKKYGQFDRQTLLKYLKGGLSPEDTWKVEKAMQDDPFLAEAMEGLDAAERFGVLTEDLEWLRRRIKKHKHRVKVLELPNLLNVAAVLLILLISAWLVIEIARNNGQTKNEIAMQKTVKKNDTASAFDYNDAGVKQENENTVRPAPGKSKVQEQAKSAEEKKAEPNTAEITLPSIRPGEEENKPNDSAGPVVSSDNIRDIKKDKIGQRPATIEDVITTSASGAGNKVETGGEISLNEGISAKRVKGKKAARADNLADMERSYEVNTVAFTDTQPVHGDSSYKEYILKNLHYPGQALISKTEGDVFLQFTVDVDSTINDIKIISGPGDGCREEAIRLIKEGPKWIPANSYGKPVKSEAVFKINFSIKK